LGNALVVGTPSEESIISRNAAASDSHFEVATITIYYIWRTEINKKKPTTT